MLNASVRTILLSTITDHMCSATTHVGSPRCGYGCTPSSSRGHGRKSATETDIYCESFRYYKSVDNGGLAQMQRLLQFGRVLSRCMQ